MLLLRQLASCPAFVPIALLATGGLSLAPKTATSPEQTVVLSGSSVGPVRFGEPQQKAVSALERLIGATEGGVRRAKGNCTIDAALYWTNFSVYFFGGRFVGYQTGNNLTAKPEPAFNGRTPRGLRVGDTLAEARKLYPGAVTTSGANGGVYAVKTRVGTIRGYLSLEISNPPSKIKIASVSAGSVGCPAASPG
ncbi:MAG: hypothetical protein ACRDZX_18580 [Acidimicrobiales bacterium]